MLITDDDIKLFLEKYNRPIKTENFTFKNKDGFWQIRNIKKYCYFFNEKTKLCNIYEFRPEGCRYYPLIYLEDINIITLISVILFIIFFYITFQWSNEEKRQLNHNKN